MSVKLKLLAPFALLIALCAGGAIFLTTGLRPILDARERALLSGEILTSASHAIADGFHAASMHSASIANGEFSEAPRFSRATTLLRKNIRLISQFDQSAALAARIDSIGPHIDDWETKLEAAVEAGDRLEAYSIDARMSRRIQPMINKLRSEAVARASVINAQANEELNADLAVAIQLVSAVGVVAGLLAFYVSRSITRPLLRLIAHARENAETGSMRRFKPLARRDEIGVLSQALAQMVAALQQKFCETEDIAFTDGATGLPNVQRLRVTATEVLETQKRPATLLLADIPRANQLEDVFGAEFLDGMVCTFAARIHDQLVEHMPEARGAGEVLIARVGPTKLAVLICGATALDRSACQSFAESMQRALEAPLALGDRRTRLAVNMALASGPSDAEDANALLSAANLALHTPVCDSNMTGRVRVFAPEMRARALKRRAIEERLRDAIDRDEFHLVYQPKLDPGGARLESVEALLRWTDPVNGPISPGVFVPIAEDTGLIAKIDDWVLRQACAQTRKWLDRGLDISVSVNVSAARFEQDGFELAVEDALKTSGLPAERLELELTETVAMAAPHRAVELLNPIRDAGVRISIDDFGSGYSSLSMLGALPLDCVKIDRSLLPCDAADRDAATIMAAAVSMARSLKLRTVAEGVETEWQRGYVAELGCSLIQGYVFSRPLSAADIEAFARERAKTQSDNERLAG